MPPSATSVSRCRAAMARNGCGPGGNVSSGASAALRLRDEIGGGVELGIASTTARGSERCSDDGSLRRSFSSSSRKVCSACASPAVPRFGRGPRRIARSSVATARASNLHSGCLSSASSVTGGSPSERRLGGEPREHAGRRVGERVAAGIVDRHVPARQRRQHAAGQRAVRRHQRGGLAGISTASRSATAIASASSSALAASITAMLSSAASAWAAKSALRQALLPKLAGRGGPQRLRSKAFAAMRRRRGASVDHASRTMPMLLQQRRHGELRMAVRGFGCRRRRRRSASRSLRRDRCRDRAAPARRAAAWRWWRAVSRSPGSSRSSLPRSPGRCWSRAAWLRPRSACRGARPARCDPFPSRSAGQCRADESSGSRSVCSQYLSISSGTSSSSRSQLHLPRRHVVHQAGEILRQRQRRGRAVGDQRRVIAAARRDRFGPFQDQLRRAARALASPSSASGRSSAAPALSPVAASAKAISSSSTSPIGTMRGRIAASRLSTSRKSLRQPAGAPGRQIDRRRRERQRIAAGLEAEPEPVLHQRLDQRRQERRRRRNREDARS